MGACEFEIYWSGKYINASSVTQSFIQSTIIVIYVCICICVYVYIH
jgi:hypothetical protein